MKLFPLLFLTTSLFAAEPVATVTSTPGLVAFWDFVKREPDGQKRFTAHVLPGATTDYPLEAANYTKDYWGAGRAATYADFPLLGRGPFGLARIHISEPTRLRRSSDGVFCLKKKKQKD